MATRLFMTSEHAFCFSSCSVASAFVMALLPPAFIDFMGGSMVSGRRRTSVGPKCRIA